MNAGHRAVTYRLAAVRLLLSGAGLRAAVRWGAAA
jgi:hypothetical protein